MTILTIHVPDEPDTVLTFGGDSFDTILAATRTTAADCAEYALMVNGFVDRDIRADGATYSMETK